MNAKPCPKRTCGGTMQTLGTGQIGDTAIHYFECATCGKYQRVEDHTHDEPQLELMSDG